MSSGLVSLRPRPSLLHSCLSRIVRPPFLMPSKAYDKGGSPAAHGERVESLFDRYSEMWEEKYRAGGTLHPRLRQFVSNLSKRVAPGERILDFGCGAGDIAAASHEAGYVVDGVDRS